LSRPAAHFVWLLLAACSLSAEPDLTPAQHIE
jgi:hypothetical protein